MIVNILIGIAVLAALGFGGFFYLGQKSQSSSAPGLVNGALAACGSAPNCVVSEAGADAKHAVAPLPLGAWAQIPDVVGDMGGTITQIGEAYVSATFTSKMFGFVDDVEFRNAEDAVHVRSASRVGYSDRGVNAARVEALRVRLAK